MAAGKSLIFSTLLPADEVEGNREGRESVRANLTVNSPSRSVNAWLQNQRGVCGCRCRAKAVAVDINHGQRRTTVNQLFVIQVRFGQHRIGTRQPGERESRQRTSVPGLVSPEQILENRPADSCRRKLPPCHRSSCKFRARTRYLLNSSGMISTIVCADQTLTRTAMSPCLASIAAFRHEAGTMSRGSVRAGAGRRVEPRQMRKSPDRSPEAF